MRGGLTKLRGGVCLAFQACTEPHPVILAIES